MITPVEQDLSCKNSLELAPLNQLMRETATQLVDYSLEIQTGDHVLIKLSPACYLFCDAIIELLSARGATWRIQIIDPDLDKLVLESVSAGGAGDTFQLPINMMGRGEASNDQAAFFHYGEGSEEVNRLTEKPKVKVLVIRDRKNAETNFVIDAALEKEVGSMSRILTDTRVNEHRWCLIAPPTENTPLPEGMSLEEYSRLFYAACSRPWAEVEKAQAVLVEKFTGANTVNIHIPAPSEFSSEWETNLTFQIEGQKPVNSVAKQNMPGSEVFMAPNQGTLNGVFAVPYPIYFRERLIPNLRLVFTNGKVTDWFCSTTNQSILELIEKTLATDDGASYCGEFGIGTNPVINIAVADPLPAEKSFGVHFALGNSYAYKHYLGTPVNVFNGNTSSIHIDVPRIMTPKYGGGQIIVDGGIVFNDGTFLDPKLAILNG